MESEFELQPDLIHLNHAAVGPWPRCTREAVETFARENATEGSFHYPEWVKKEARLRQLLAQLIHAPQADDIALLKEYLRSPVGGRTRAYLASRRQCCYQRSGISF